MYFFKNIYPLFYKTMKKLRLVCLCCIQLEVRPKLHLEQIVKFHLSYIRKQKALKWDIQNRISLLIICSFFLKLLNSRKQLVFFVCELK